MNKEKALRIFRALGEETRYLIVQTLCEKELCACEIHEKIDRTQSNTSMHLAKLLDAGILKSRRDGKRIIYSVADDDVRQIMSMISGEGI